MKTSRLTQWMCVNSMPLDYKALVGPLPLAPADDPAAPFLEARRVVGRDSVTPLAKLAGETLVPRSRGRLFNDLWGVEWLVECN
jgi:hypothetical protein